MYINLNISLSREEEKILFKKLSDGDLISRTKLIEYNMRLVYYFVKEKYSNTFYEYDDLISICTIGLIKAIDSYKITKNCKFSVYAFTCMDNEIKMYHRKEFKTLLNETFDNNKENIYFNTTNQFEEDLIDKYLYIEINNIIENLDEKEREILKMFFGFYNKKYTQQEISIRFNVSQSRISSQIRNSVQKVKKKLIENNFI